MELIRIIFFISIGAYLSLSFYHLAIFHGRRRDFANLYLSLLLMGIASVVFVRGIFPYPPNGIQKTCLFITHVAMGCALMMFSYTTLGNKELIKTAVTFVKWAAAGAVASVLLIVMIPNNEFSFRITIIYTIPMSIFAIIMAARISVYYLKSKDADYKQNWRTWIFRALIIYGTFFFIGMAMILMRVSSHVVALVYNIGAMILALLSAFSLASKYNKEYKELVFLQKHLESEVVSRTRELEEANKIKTNLFINLAHDTRTPAILIQNYIDRCVSRYPQDRDLKVVKANIGKLVKDMVNFLDAEKIEQGRLIYDTKERFDISCYLRNKIDLIKPTAQMRGLEITCFGTENIMITSSHDLLDRVVNNLMDNAMRYTPRGGTISVGWKKLDDNYVQIEISDDGPGIEEDKREHIFEKYYQITHEKGNTQGIGMGLYISRSIVESVGGELYLAKQNKGTSFIIKLPVGRGGTFRVLNTGSIENDIYVPPVKSSDLPVSIDKGKDTVLIVEDNPDLLQAMEEDLREEFNVLCAANGLAALEMTKQYDADIIVSDIMMDGMDGYELIRRVREDKALKEIPFVFTSAKSALRDEMEGLSLGAIEYIKKPFTLEELRMRIKAIINYTSIKKQAYELEKYKSVGRLTAGICHEIANPLEGIKGPLYVIEKIVGRTNNGNEKLEKCFDHVKTSIRRISDIVGTMRRLFHD